MRLKEIFRLVFTHINESKVKVFLTSLGIVVGTLTIVMVLAIGQGSQESVEEQFNNMSVGTILVMERFGPDAGTIRETLDMEVVEALKTEGSAIERVTISISGRADAVYNRNTYGATVAGVSSDYAELNNLNIKYGRFINEEDILDGNKSVVLGSLLADYLFDESYDESKIGENVILGGKRYEVVGILEYRGDSGPGMNSDEGAFMPYEVAEKYVTGQSVKPSITVVAKDFDHVEEAMEDIESVLLDKFGDNSDSFQLRDAGSRVQSAKDSARVMTLMLFSVAVIVLTVGGIGIMNVMFVSVKERTKEIGILKAIGAKKRDIMLQFILESVLLSSAGGVVGILATFLFMPLLDIFDVNAIFTPLGYVIAFGFSVFTGIFFGYYPASKAADLKPIDALNYE